MHVRQTYESIPPRSAAELPQPQRRLPTARLYVQPTRLWVQSMLVAVVFTAAMIVMFTHDIHPRAFAVRLLLLMLPIVAVAAGLGVFCLSPRLRAILGGIETHPLVMLTCLVYLGGLSLFLVEFETSDVIRSRRGLALLILLNLASLGGAWLAGRLAARSPRFHRLGRGRFALVASAGLAITCSLLDRNDHLAAFWPLRNVHTLVQAAFILLTAAFATHHGYVGRRTAALGGLLLAGACALAFTLPHADTHATFVRVVKRHGSEATILRLLRWLGDDDGDGFSDSFDGGDCDDHDPRAFPLGPIDCDHLLRPTHTATPKIDVKPVKRLMLVTIDTFRCELGGERLCPALDARVGDAAFVGRQRVYISRTAYSLAVLLGGPMSENLKSLDRVPSYLVEQAGRAGYWRSAHYPILGFRVPSLAGLFDDRDDSVAAKLTSTTVASAAETRHVIDDLTRHQGDARPLFEWVHYLEPHAPYVPTPEGAPTPLFLFGRASSYAAEVRRTENDVAHLVDAARARGFDRDAAIVVTGDHGESFDHGHYYHGHSLYEPETEVPLYVWLFDEAGQPRKLALPQPLVERDVAALLAALVGAPPPQQQTAVSAQIPDEGIEQYAIVDDGWKLIYHRQERYEELYDLRSDPGELHDQSEHAPAMLQRLRGRLGEELAPLFTPRS